MDTFGFMIQKLLGIFRFQKQENNKQKKEKTNEQKTFQILEINDDSVFTQHR